MSAILMLRHIGEFDAANRIEKAMLEVYAEGKHLTRDLGGTAKTNEFARAVCDKLSGEASAKA
jgi:isocitrate dehydrogenase (NAD+)